MRPCDVAAIAIQDAIFLGREHRDTDYAARRENAFVVAVDCGFPEGSCFCASMDTGPTAREGFDLALTELLDRDGHRFRVRAGSAAGATLLRRLPTRAETDADRIAAGALERRAVERMGRRLDLDGLAEALERAREHPHWHRVADRCLACANCTLVCPTCFCHEVEDTIDLTGETAARRRAWSSCFASDHSYIHGGPIRASTAARYRQWLTHKLSGWQRQFGRCGCVGCGRCITWCPVGIDLTEEVRALEVSR